MNRRFNKVDPLYKKWRAAVIRRDKNRCQMPDCPYRDKSGKRTMQAHHIRRWADCILTRYEVSNGITLCKGCHARIRNQETAYMLLFTQIVIENGQANNTNR